MIVTFPPGGGTDFAARVLTEQLSRLLQQQVVVDNRPGADGTLGVQLAARTQPDGHSIALTNNGALLEETIDEAFPAIRPLFGTHSYFASSFGTAKPDPAIFRALCQRLGTRPEETLFLDDGPENAEGARAAGLIGHHFTGIGPFRDELARFGLP